MSFSARCAVKKVNVHLLQVHLTENEVDSDDQIAHNHLNNILTNCRSHLTHFASILLLLHGEPRPVHHPQVPHERGLAGLAGAEKEDLVVPPHLPLVLADLTLDLGVDSPDLLKVQDI